MRRGRTLPIEIKDLGAMKPTINRPPQRLERPVLRKRRRPVLSETYLRAIAHHEAGHAVACVRFGIAFEHVALTPDDPARGGFLRHPGSGSMKTRRVYVSRRTLANEVFMMMAGDAAVRPFFTASEEHFAANRSGDAEQAMRLLEWRGYYDPEQNYDAGNQVFCHVPPAERAAFVEEQRQRAIKWAKSHSDSGGYWAIKAVADALVYRRTLNSEEVAAIIKNAIWVVCGRV